MIVTDLYEHTKMRHHRRGEKFNTDRRYMGMRSTEQNLSDKKIVAKMRREIFEQEIRHFLPKRYWRDIRWTVTKGTPRGEPEEIFDGLCWRQIWHLRGGKAKMKSCRCGNNKTLRLWERK
jgi:hypothetical protein